MATAYSALTFLIACFTIDYTMAETPAEIGPAIVEQEEEDMVSQAHRRDSVTILMLLCLLLLTILTVWLFKHRRFRFVHETGLSVFYGLIVGAVIRYTSNPEVKRTALAKLVNYTVTKAPEAVFINFPAHLTNNTVDSVEIMKYNLEKIVSTQEEEEAALERTVTFDPEIFFNVFLPIIIFEAGYSMKRRHFFRNFGAIIMYAFVGTTISCLVVGGLMYAFIQLMDVDFGLNDCFFFGAIISATDPVTVLAIFNDLNVDVNLYALVFGESVLNDAVAIVLSGSVEAYGQASSGQFSAHAFFKALGNFAGIFGGAFAIGSAIGMITALLTKYTKIRDFPLLETALFFLMSYSSFQAAEAAGLTGIVAVLFCGICQAHYTYNNLSTESKQRTKQVFELMNFLAENFVFLYIGVSVFTFEHQEWHAGFIMAAFFSIIVARFCNVYPLSLILNIGRRNKIKSNMIHMMMFSGLRGAIAYALAIRNTSSPARKLMLSATMMIVLVTVILCGGFVTPMLQWLQIRVGVDEEETAGGAVRSAMSRQRQYSTMEGGGSSPGDVPSQTQPSYEPSLDSTHQIAPLLQSNNQAQQEIRARSFGKAYLVAKWYKFDMMFLKPFLTNSRPNLMETCPGCCMGLARMLTTEEQLTQGESHMDNDSDTDMIIDPSELSVGEESQISAVSNPSINSPLDKDHVELPDDSMTGDLGLGDRMQPMRLQVNFGSPTGEQV